MRPDGYYIWLVVLRENGWERQSVRAEMTDLVDALEGAESAYYCANRERASVKESILNAIWHREQEDMKRNGKSA